MDWRDRARRANRQWRFHLLAASGIGLSLAAIVSAQQSLLGWSDGQRLAALALVYGASGFGGTAVGSWLARVVATGGARGFAAWALLAGGLTMALGGLIFALTYRAAYVQWHGEPFSLEWGAQGFFTMVGASYFWAVLGTRMVLPFAIVPLALGALAFARRRG